MPKLCEVVRVEVKDELGRRELRRRIQSARRSINKPGVTTLFGASRAFWERLMRNRFGLRGPRHRMPGPYRQSSPNFSSNEGTEA